MTHHTDLLQSNGSPPTMISTRPERRGRSIFTALVAGAVIYALAGCQSQPQDPLPDGRYIDLRDGACALRAVRGAEVISLDATGCHDSRVFGVVASDITLQTPDCGIVRFVPSGGILNRRTYVAEPLNIPKCSVDRLDDYDPIWIALR